MFLYVLNNTGLTYSHLIQILILITDVKPVLSFSKLKICVLHFLEFSGTHWDLLFVYRSRGTEFVKSVV